MPAQALVGTVLDEWLDPAGDYVLVGDGRILRVASGKPPSWAGIVDLGGYLFPAFIDAHAHLSWLGLLLNGVDLRGSRSPGEVAERLARAPGPVAYGRGWDQEEFEPRGSMPDRRLLDARVPGRPAVAVRTCGHLAVANTLALDLTRPWEAYPGLVDRDKGLLLEDAVYYVVERLLDALDVSKLVEDASKALASTGVGGVASMACPPSEARALAGGAAKRLLVACYPKPGDLDEARALLAGSPHARVAGVKLFADGSLGARTAFLREPYSDDPGNRGRRLLTAGEIMEASKPVLTAGLRVAVHAIGDAALDEVLGAFEALDPGPQGRVEHASIVWDDQLSRLEPLQVHVVVQPHFRVSDWWINERLGERARLAYRLRSLYKRLPLALSTDAPVEPYEPWETLAAAAGQCRQPACRAEESLSWREAFHSYTRLSAQAAGGPLEEAGTLEPGSPPLITWSPRDPRDPGWRGPARLVYPPAGPHL